MGIIKTKFDNAKFDVDLFDFRYSTNAEDPLPEDGQNDYSNILDEAGSDYTITQQVTTDDGSGNVIDVVETSFTGRAYLQHLNLKESNLLSQGIVVQGDIKGFFKHEYVIGNDTFIVKEGDIVTDEDSKDWRITKILGERFISNNEVLRVTILQRIDNEGTP